MATREFLFTTGNHMIAEAAVKAGCRFFAGYPITPASGIYKSMIEMLQAKGELAISAPDEISALAFCVGASMRGAKAMTATSGPGWALMSETVQYALMTETPVVIAMVQRLGPSTGGATQGAQGDLLLVEFSTSGGYTIPVFAPTTATDSYEVTLHAFNWSERLRMPVVVLSDKEIAMTSERVDVDLLPVIPIEERKLVEGQSPGMSLMYDFTQLEDVPAFLEVGGERKVTFTGSAHNKRGDLKKNDTETLEVLKHLEEKVRYRRHEMELVEFDHEKGAELLLISYGITARSTRSAVEILRSKGQKVSHLVIKSLFPIPENALLRSLEGIRKVVLPEENMHGQYLRMLAPYLKGVNSTGVNKIGSMITPEEVCDACE